MINNATIAGRLTQEPKVLEYEDGTKYMLFYLAVPRLFRSKGSGNTEADYIRCKLFGGKTKVIEENCKKGSLIGFTGRQASKVIEVEGEPNKNEQYFAIEKIILFPKSLAEVNPTRNTKPVKGEGVVRLDEGEKEIKKKDKVPF